MELKASPLNDLSNLMALAFEVMDSQTGRTIPDDRIWRNDAQILSIKIFRHLYSAIQICKGTDFKRQNLEEITYIDFSSIAVLVRTAYESYLALHYIFSEQDHNVVEYRHRAWRLAGLKDRAKLFANTPESKEKLRLEGLSIEEHMTQLKAHPHHQTLGDKGKTRVLGGEWMPFGGWPKVSLLAEIHPRYFFDIYRSLSSHAHGGYISALQIRDTNTGPAQRAFSESILANATFILAHLLHTYVKIFPEARDILLSSIEYDTVVAWYIRTQDVEKLYGLASDYLKN